MRRLALLLLLTTACSRESSQQKVVPEPSATVVAPQPTRHLGPRAGLSLKARLAEPGPFEVGRGRPELKAKLVNQTEGPVPVVQLSDGSSQPEWREPYVFYTVEHFTLDGEWKPVSPGDTGRCGMHDEDWSDEVQTVEPGESLELDLRWAYFSHNLQLAGPYRVRVHYRFQGDYPKQSPPVSTTRMAGESAYELVSEPITFQMVRPIDVHLEVLAPMEAGVASSVDEVVRLEVKNLSSKARAIPGAAGHNIQFEIVGQGAVTPSLPYARPDSGSSHRLSPDEKVTVIGPKSFAPITPPAGWNIGKPGRYLVRVDYLGVKSNWAELVVK